MSAVDEPGFDRSRSPAGNRNPWLIAVVIALATFMEVLDISIANVALQHIAGSLAASVDESTWILTSYLVANAVVLPISGWLANAIGRKRFFMICIAVFTVASILCGLAPSLGWLIAFRVLQGLGGGGMVPIGQAILADCFPPRKRGQAFGIFGIAVVVAPTVGPTLGGWLTDNYSWHWIFFINAPVGLLSLVLIGWLLIEPEVLERERRERLAAGLSVDWVGFALVVVFFGCLEVVLDKGQREDWFQSDFIITFATLSALGLALLVPWELNHEQPMVNVRLLIGRQFGTCCLLMIATFAVLLGATQLLPQLLQTTFGYTATLAGLVLLPAGVVMGAMMPIAGALTAVVQPKYLIAFGMLCAAFGMWHTATLTADSNFYFFVWARLLQTLGLPFLFIPITSASYANLPPDKTNEAAALINVARNLGGSIGVSLGTTFLLDGVQRHQAYLVANLAPSSLQFQQALSGAQAELIAQGTPPAEAKQQAFGVIGQIVTGQATMMSYIDVFTLFAVLTAVMAAVALVALKRVDLGRAQPAGCRVRSHSVRTASIIRRQNPARVQYGRSGVASQGCASAGACAGTRMARRLAAASSIASLMMPGRGHSPMSTRGVAEISSNPSRSMSRMVTLRESARLNESHRPCRETAYAVLRLGSIQQVLYFRSVICSI
jgi:MFS transporter, DHA2 family, multidrug resistance protein